MSCSTEPKKCLEIEEFDCYGDASKCIPISKVCDGHNDCQHREDEETAMCFRKCFRIFANSLCAALCIHIITNKFALCNLEY